MKTVLFFGSFNPIHRGHTEMARWLLRSGMADEVWLVVSPQNPFKQSAELAPEICRLAMARLATTGMERVEVSDVELSMPRPSYTIDTLRRLGKENPERKFATMTGSDNLERIGNWRESERLLTEYDFLIYPREGYSLPAALPSESMVALSDAPLWSYSSTEVRQALRRGEGDEMVAPEVMSYIREHRLYGVGDVSGEVPLSPEVAGLLTEGRRLYRAGEMDGALNRFIKARALAPDNREAQGYVEQISEIFEFRYKDIYNP
jgi:nicotinate-nucleotide adenylyltransferase